jgi:hypothetical protein
MKLLLVIAFAVGARPRLEFQHWRRDVRRIAVQGLYRCTCNELERA